jgi:hypothetical protein
MLIIPRSKHRLWDNQSALRTLHKHQSRNKGMYYLSTQNSMLVTGTVSGHGFLIHRRCTCYRIGVRVIPTGPQPNARLRLGLWIGMDQQRVNIDQSTHEVLLGCARRPNSDSAAMASRHGSESGWCEREASFPPLHQRVSVFSICAKLSTYGTRQ